MKNNKPKIGGMSTPRGITFISNHYASHVNFKESSIEISKSGRPKLDSLSKIPLIRGVYCLFLLLWAYKIFLFIFAGIYLISAITPSSGVEVSTKYLFGFFILAYGGLFYYIYSCRSNHSIEHKLINAHETDCLKNIKGVMSQPKEARRCGGVLFIWFLTIRLVLLFFIPDSIFSFMLSFSIAYEIFLLATMYDFFYYPGYLIQKLTTSNNVKEKKVILARKGIQELIKWERRVENEA